MSRGSENYRISYPISHFRFRPEVAVQEWLTAHSKRNQLKMRSFGFIAEKLIKPEAK